MKKLNRVLSILLTLSFLIVLAAPAYAADPATASGLVITEGSCGTLVASEEQQATITLQNPTDAPIDIQLVNLGEASTVTIAAGESYTFAAPSVYDEDGNAYKLALTGVSADETAEYAIAPDTTLDGDTAYTVTLVKGVLDYYVSHGQETARWITCLIYADENGVEPVYSVLAGVAGTVEAGATELSDLTIRSYNDNTAAIRVGGTGSLTVSNADIALYGDGGDDFTGIGSALGVADTGTLTVSDSTVYTEGIIRSGIFAGDQGTMNLSGVTVDCEPGEYQSDVDIPSAGMASPPNGLGIWGNCRTMNLVDEGTVNIDASEITAQNWGVLGVDDVTDGHLTVTDSTIRIREQGYGSYAIGKCVDTFDHCVFEIEYGVVNYAAAGDGAEVILQNGTDARSNSYYGIVTHQSFNGTNTKITVTGEDTVLSAALGGIIAKGRGTDIEISDGGVVTADSGVLIRAQINDDTGAGTMDGTETVNVNIQNTDLVGDIIQGMGTPYEGAEDDAASGDAAAAEAADPGAAAAADPAAAGEANPAEAAADPGAAAEGANPAEAAADPGAAAAGGDAGAAGGAGGGAGGPGGPGGPGDSSSSAKTESTMNVTLDGASLEGIISSATLTLAISDGNISMDNIEDVGIVTDTAIEYNEFAKLNVELKNEASWILTDTAYLMSLTLDEGSTLTAQPGYKVVMTVDGTETAIEPGTYTGEIQLSVAVDEDYVAPEASAAEETSTVEAAPVQSEAAVAAEPESAAEAAASAAETAETTAAPAKNGIGAGGIAGIIVAVLAVAGIATVAIRKKK